MLPETVPYLMKRNQLGLTEKYFRKYRNKKGETTKAGFEDLRTSILAQQSMGMTNFYILSPGTSLKVSLGHFAQYYDIGDLSWLLLLQLNANTYGIRRNLSKRRTRRAMNFGEIVV